MNRLNDLREERDLKQKDIANMLGIARSTYSGFELEYINISIDTLMFLSNFYNTSVDYILCRTDNRKIYKKSKRNVGNRLKLLRKDLGYSQSEFSNLFRFSQTGYSAYERNLYNIPVVVLHKLADFYNTSIDYILGLTDDKERYENSILMN